MLDVHLFLQCYQANVLSPSNCLIVHGMITLTNISAIKHQEVPLDVTLIRNKGEFELVRYLTVKVLTKTTPFHLH